MGGCYSTTSHRAASSPRDTLPRKKSGRRSKKDKHYTPVSNGNPLLHPHTDKSNGQPVSIEDIQIEEDLGPRQLLREGKGVVPSDSGIESLDSPLEEWHRETSVNNERLVTSNLVSPLEQLTEEALQNKEYTLCQECHSILNKINLGPCPHCGQFRIDYSQLAVLLNTDGNCTCECDSHQHASSSACRTHGAITVVAASVHRNADSKHVMLHSDGQDTRHSDKETSHNNTSTCIDRCKKHTEKKTSINCGRLRFRAPLARGDSIERLDERSEEVIHCDGAFLATKISVCHEVLDCVCRCDFSDGSVNIFYNGFSDKSLVIHTIDGETYVRGSLKILLSSSPTSSSRLPVGSEHLCVARRHDDDDDSGHGVAKSENRSGSVSDLDMEVEPGMEELRETSDPSSPFRRAAARALDTMPMTDDSQEMVCPVTVNGREMMMIDAKTFSDMLKDLALLKEQLHNLTQVIQEEDMDSVRRLNYSLEEES